MIETASGLQIEVITEGDGELPALDATVTVDLESQTITGPDGGSISFEIDPFKKHCLMNGLDDIGLTLEKAASIDAYEGKLDERPWV